MDPMSIASITTTITSMSLVFFLVVFLMALRPESRVMATDGYPMLDSIANLIGSIPKELRMVILGVFFVFFFAMPFYSSTLATKANFTENDKEI